MKAIWKQELVAVDDQEIDLPAGARILCVQTQREKPCIWFVNPDVDSDKKEKRKIRIYGTGHEYEYFPRTYIGTFQLHGGELVYHVFEEV